MAPEMPSAQGRDALQDAPAPQKSSHIASIHSPSQLATQSEAGSSSGLKHIDLRAHFIRDCVNNRTIDVVRVQGTENLADIFTKPLARIAHVRGVKLLNLDPRQGGVLSSDLGGWTY